MNKVNFDMYLKLITISLSLILLIIALLRHKKIWKDKNKIAFSYNMEKWRILYQVAFVALAAGSIFHLVCSHNNIDRIVNSIFVFSISITSLANCTIGIVMTQCGLAYNSYLNSPRIFLRWNNIQSYYIVESPKGNKIKITIDYYNNRWKLKQLNFEISKKDGEKVKSIFEKFMYK